MLTKGTLSNPACSESDKKRTIGGGRKVFPDY